MLIVLYLMLFLGLAAALLRWQAVRYDREHALLPQRVRRK